MDIGTVRCSKSDRDIYSAQQSQMFDSVPFFTKIRKKEIFRSDYQLFWLDVSFVFELELLNKNSTDLRELELISCSTIVLMSMGGKRCIMTLGCARECLYQFFEHKTFG